MKEWNPQWEKQWSKTESMWKNIKVVYNWFYIHQQEYKLFAYRIESDEKIRRDFNNQYPRIRDDLWSYTRLYQAIDKNSLPGTNLNTQVCLALRRKEVVDFFKKYFIITTNSEVKAVEQRKLKAIFAESNVRDCCTRGTIYGIFIWDKLVYIGKTLRKPEERWREHIEYAQNPQLESNQQKFLYDAMRKNQGHVEFKILKQDNFANNDELEKLEKILIENLQPQYNYEGVKVPYKFSKDKKE